VSEARILSVCVSEPVTVLHEGKEVLTGIFKQPVEERVRVGEMGIVDDGQADLTVHGGRDKAVYVYAAQHYPVWAAELGREELEPGQFGENLTVSGIDEANVRIGDRVAFGSVIGIVSQPRIPCYKLGIRMGDGGFPKRFTEAGRPGFYLRIEQVGETGVGDAFELVEEAEHGITVADLWRIVFGGKSESSRRDAARCLDVMPYLDAGWRRRLGNVGQTRRV
jgi:MOSC domain-containing protein YiiM